MMPAFVGDVEETSDGKKARFIFNSGTITVSDSIVIDPDGTKRIYGEKSWSIP